MLTEAIEKKLGIKKEELTRINDGFQNIVYSYKTSGKDFILRLTHSDRRSIEAIKHELEFIKVLRNAELSVSIPLESTNNIRGINEKGQEWFAVIFEKAKGKPLDVTDKNIWNKGLFYNWGKLMGEMHKQSTNSSLLTNLSNRPSWSEKNPDVLGLFPRISSEIIRNRYGSLLEQLKEFSPLPGLFGLIHNDFHQDNFFVDGQTITVFDFDDCSYHWYAYDMAVSFYHAFWQVTSFTPEYTDFSEVFWHYFLTGYCSAHKLRNEILQQVPIFLKIREIFLIVLFKEKWDLENLEEWQKYTLNDLEDRIINKIPFSKTIFDSFYK
ncbi:phosphotransferase [Neobacillus sp. PS3-34]|uniref:phosphotransferase enzyme family protein n=1 Tax=Neobacillus sp. PS3-34 TaxID=3070678 RepID=UPI0027E1A690|nr:phosphotransferase [Neobacillus sp. PS3-34]WML48184.1 phosphotransferase [Neobacillus sp. PS3-34]